MQGRGLGVEVVARAVEVDWDQIYGVEAVLVAMRLALDQEHLLCRTVWGVGLLRITIPKVVLVKWHRCELWVCAYRANGQDLGHAREAALLDQLYAHDRVVVEEATRAFPTGADHARNRREMDDQIGPAIG